MLGRRSLFALAAGAAALPLMPVSAAMVAEPVADVEVYVFSDGDWILRPLRALYDDGWFSADEYSELSALGPYLAIVTSPSQPDPPGR